MLVYPVQGDQTPRRLSVADYLNKMKAGWIGQMVGVGWGGPTEFKWKGEIIPLDKMPKWKPAMVNQFNQDDLYVEMTFLRSLELHGLDVSIRQAGIDFASEFGIDLDGLRAKRRPLCRECLDWSARQSHLAGSFGAALLDRFYDLGWARRVPESRIVRFSDAGEKSFHELINP